MYIQIDPRCHMGCAHCGFACTPQGYGEYHKPMSVKVYEAALEMAESHGEYITLGGGEPTNHPRFEEFLIKAIGATDKYGVQVITAGYHTKKALLLAKLAKAGIVGAELSLDEYHTGVTVAPEVRRAFTRSQPSGYGGYGQRDDDLRGIRTVKSIVSSGRGKEISGSVEDDCICEDLFIAPDGSVKFCGCLDSPVIGHVLTGILPEWEETVAERSEYGCHRLGMF